MTHHDAEKTIESWEILAAELSFYITAYTCNKELGLLSIYQYISMAIFAVICST